MRRREFLSAVAAVATGPARAADPQGDTLGSDLGISGVQDPAPAAGQDGAVITDLTQLVLQIRVPPNVTGFSFDFIFFSAEYPEYADQGFEIAGDGGGHLYAVWLDDRWGGWSVYAQKIDEDGNNLWTGGGLRLCRKVSEIRNPRIRLGKVDGGRKNILVVWEEKRTDWDIHGQLLDEMGGIIWKRNGVPLVSGEEDQVNPSVELGERGEIYISYEDHSRLDSDIYYSVIEPDECITSVDHKEGIGEIDLQCFPNPFNSTITIRYLNKSKGKVSLEIYDCIGKKVWAGEDSYPDGVFFWEGTDGRGKKLSSGVYFCRVRCGDAEEVRKITLVR